MSLDTYTPSPQQQAQLELLFKLLELVEQKGIKTYITGGYGLDALYGRLTRDHRDIDVYISLKDEEEFKEVLKILGFYPSGITVGEIGKKEYKNNNFPEEFTLEYGLLENAAKLLSKEEMSVSIPDTPIGQLQGKPIWTASLKAFKIMIEFNNSPAAKHTEPYRNQLWLDTILPELEKKFDR